MRHLACCFGAWNCDMFRRISLSGDRRISEPSAVFWSNISGEVEVPSKPTPSELHQRHIQDSVGPFRSHLSNISHEFAGWNVHISHDLHGYMITFTVEDIEFWYFRYLTQSKLHAKRHVRSPELVSCRCQLLRHRKVKNWEAGLQRAILVQADVSCVADCFGIYLNECEQWKKGPLLFREL